MFRLFTSMVCLLAAGSVFGQAHSASYTKDYQREAHDIAERLLKDTPDHRSGPR